MARQRKDFLSTQRERERWKISMHELPRFTPDWVCCKSIAEWPYLWLRIIFGRAVVRDERHREQICGCLWAEGDGANREHRSTHYHKQNSFASESFLYGSGNQPGLCDNIEGRDGVGGGRVVCRTHISILHADGRNQHSKCKATILY